MLFCNGTILYIGFLMVPLVLTYYLTHLPLGSFQANFGYCWLRYLLWDYLNSSWPSATYMRRDFQCLFPQCPRYVALISVLISPMPHIWGVTKGSLLASPPNSRRSPTSLISLAPVKDPYPYTCCVENIKCCHQNIGCSSQLPSSINCSCWNKWENLHNLL